MRQRKKRMGLRKPILIGEKLEFKKSNNSVLIVHFPRGRVTKEGAMRFVEVLKDLTKIRVTGTFQDCDTIRYTGIEVR